MTRIKTVGLILLLFSITNLQAQIFSPGQTISTSDNPQVVKSADFNADGYNDIVYSSITDHKIAVALFNPEKDHFETEQVVTTSFNYAVSLFPAFLDGDSAIDLLTVSQLNHKVAWFKNDGTGSLTLQPLISNNAHGAISVIAADIDGDNDYDVIAASKDDNTIQWYENTDGNGNFSSGHIITDMGEYPVVIVPADIDNDTDADIVAGMLAGNKIVWFANDGFGNFGKENIITTEINIISALLAADLNGDNYIDIISASRNDNKIAWYENLGGGGNFSAQIIVSDDFTMPFDISAADFDLDNDIDLVCSAMGGNEIRLFSNSDGAGSFVPAQMISNVCKQPKGLAPGDFDDDGDMDVVAALSQQDPDEVVWYENGEAAFVVHTINKNRDVWEIAIHDINNDGNKDIFYSDGQAVCWIENLNSAQSFGDETILWQGYNIFEIALNDIDNDEDQDLFIADAQGDKVVWLRNNDGNGTFGSEIIIDDNGDGPADIDFSDVDGDLDDDLLVFFVNESTVALYENTDGQGTFTKSIVASAEQYSGCFIDFDQDDDDDIAYSAYSEICIMENDGTGSFSSPQTIAGLGYAWKILPAFINDDLYPDLVYSPDYYLHWLGNNQNGTFTDHQVDLWGSVNDLAISDLDNDEDPDILSACRSVGLVNYSENMNNGDTLITTLPILVYEANAVKAADLNNDGWNDVVVGTWPDEALCWAENYQFRILIHPFDQYACEGDDAYFPVVSTGVKTYQWQVNPGSGFSDIFDDDTYSGTDQAQLSIHDITSGLFNNEYRCRVYDKSGFELITDAAFLYQDCSTLPGQPADHSGIFLFPNPTTGILYLPECIKATNLIIKDMSGKTVFRNATFKKNQIDMANFEEGIYILLIHTENCILSQKIIKL